MAHLLPSPKMQFFDINGDPLSGGKVNAYEAGTSTRKATYTTAAAVVANANPVILNSRGEANIFWSTGSYKIVLTDSADSEIYSVDSITLSATGAAGSSFRAGSGVPSDALGSDGDRYLRSDTGQIYLKDSGVYSVENTISLPGTAIVNTPSGNLAAISVQAALNELQTDLDTRATSTALNDHMIDTSTHGVGEVLGRTDSQVVTNKSIDADSNTITNIENADIKALAAIDATKIADGSVTSAEFQYINTLTSNAQTQINAKASTSDLTTHTSATVAHGTAGDIVGTTDTQTLTNKTVGLVNGLVGTPSLNFTADTDTGIYRIGADSMGLSAGGFLGVEVKKSTGSFANIGMGGTASASDQIPLTLERSNTSAGTYVATVNTSTSANAYGGYRATSDNGDSVVALNTYTAASTVTAFISRAVLRSEGNTTGISILLLGSGGQDIRFYHNGGAATDESVRINTDKSFQFMRQIATPATPASNTVKMYQKSDDSIYVLNDLGVESKLLTSASAVGGGGGLRFLEGANSPVLTFENELEVYEYQPGLAQELYLAIRVPASYSSGSAINLRILWTCASTSGNALINAVATLIRSEVDEIQSTTNQRTTTNAAITLTVNNDLEPQKIALDISSSIGQINAVDIVAGDLIKVRVKESSSTVADNIKLIPDASEVSFS